MWGRLELGSASGLPRRGCHRSISHQGVTGVVGDLQLILVISGPSDTALSGSPSVPEPWLQLHVRRPFLLESSHSYSIPASPLRLGGSIRTAVPRPGSDSEMRQLTMLPFLFQDTLLLRTWGLGLQTPAGKLSTADP